MKTKLLLIIMGFILLLGAIGAYSQDEEIVVMDTSAFENTQRPASVFDHDIHNEMAGLEDDCAICHHVYDGKTLVEGESSEDSYCADCHSLSKTAENDVPLRAAYHKRCKSCHFETNKGPVLCGECHKN
ncbi:MAG: acidic cytochrome c TcmA [Desulfobacteraceae bacterium]|nr:MAG: acidic cytochrome c TcmA [Desulfobacteraceae bacterium]